MKNVVGHKNKLQDWEREKHYQVHLDRMKSIGSQKRARERKQQVRQRNMSGSQLPAIRNPGRFGFSREIQIENERIMKKLNQIGRRKSQFVKQTRDEKNYYTISIKSRAATRKHKQTMIQQQNDLMVERILQKRSASKGLLHDLSIDSKSSLKKSRKKKNRNSSMILPELDTHPQIPNIQDQI